MKKLIILLFSIAIFTSCNNSNWPTPKSSESSTESGMKNESSTTSGKDKMVVVMEALNGGAYTYLRLSQDGDEFWAAISARPVIVGKTYYYQESVIMRNFESKQLQKTFDSIMFIDYFGEFPKDMTTAVPHVSTAGHTSTSRNENLSIEYAQDEISLGELFENKDSYKEKQIRVRGEVVKISRNIMGRNWIHIQDGTSYQELYDLTITINTPVGFEVNDIVAFKGTLNLDKDFGAGYLYPVIMEEAEVVDK